MVVWGLFFECVCFFCGVYVFLEGIIWYFVVLYGVFNGVLWCSMVFYSVLYDLVETLLDMQPLWPSTSNFWCPFGEASLVDRSRRRPLQQLETAGNSDLCETVERAMDSWLAGRANGSVSSAHVWRCSSWSKQNASQRRVLARCMPLSTCYDNACAAAESMHGPSWSARCF